MDCTREEKKKEVLSIAVYRPSVASENEGRFAHFWTHALNFVHPRDSCCAPPLYWFCYIQYQVHIYHLCSLPSPAKSPLAGTFVAILYCMAYTTYIYAQSLVHATYQWAHINTSTPNMCSFQHTHLHTTTVYKFILKKKKLSLYMY